MTISYISRSYLLVPLCMVVTAWMSNKVEAAYRRGDLLAKRQQLMQDWADYALGRRAGNMTDGHSAGGAASTRDVN